MLNAYRTTNFHQCLLPLSAFLSLNVGSTLCLWEVQKYLWVGSQTGGRSLGLCRCSGRTDPNSSAQLLTTEPSCGFNKNSPWIGLAWTQMLDCQQEAHHWCDHAGKAIGTGGQPVSRGLCGLRVLANHLSAVISRFFPSAAPASPVHLYLWSTHRWKPVDFFQLLPHRDSLQVEPTCREWLCITFPPFPLDLDF